MPSSYTEIDIINKALTLLGDVQIASRSENSPPAKAMDALYDGARDRVLRECPWNFAVKRTSLASSGTPAWGDFDKTYPLPADFLYLMHTEDFSDYALEGQEILADPTNNVSGGPLKIKYVARITDASRYDTLFTEALAYRLAYEACERITQSNTKKADLFQEYELTVTRAKRINGQEDAPEAYVEDEWNIARVGEQKQRAT